MRFTPLAGKSMETVKQTFPLTNPYSPFLLIPMILLGAVPSLPKTSKNCVGDTTRSSVYAPAEASCIPPLPEALNLLS